MMRLIKWDPFKELADFPEFRLSSDLAVDMYEDGNVLIVEVNAPGIDHDKINVTVENHLLRVSGSRKQKTEKKGKDFYHKEIKCGSFERHITLPYAVQEDKACAEYADGVLKISLPKKEEKPSEKIKVTVKK